MTSDVGVPSTHLVVNDYIFSAITVDCENRNSCYQIEANGFCKYLIVIFLFKGYIIPHPATKICDLYMLYDVKHAFFI